MASWWTRQSPVWSARSSPPLRGQPCSGLAVAQISRPALGPARSVAAAPLAVPDSRLLQAGNRPLRQPPAPSNVEGHSPPVVGFDRLVFMPLDSTRRGRASGERDRGPACCRGAARMRRVLADGRVPGAAVASTLRARRPFAAGRPPTLAAGAFPRLPRLGRSPRSRNGAPSAGEPRWLDGRDVSRGAAKRAGRGAKSAFPSRSWNRSRTFS